jgi:hypothetical protein
VNRYDGTVAAATLRILARNIESDGFEPIAANALSPLKLQFSEFSIELLDQGKRRRLEYARQFFKGAMFDEFLIEREYEVIPPAPQAYSGFGALPSDAEDLLLLLRLFRPGDLAFVSLSVQEPGSQPSIQYPYRVISNLVPAFSTRPFVLNQSDITAWEEFAASLRAAPSWKSRWFEVSRRYFLYGGSTEFNANFPTEVDRVMDYTTALESALVPEMDFVSRRLRERALKMLGLSGEVAEKAKKLLKEFYSIRSTLVHGSRLSSDQLSLLQSRARWLEFERLVRHLIVAALRNIPPGDIEFVVARDGVEPPTPAFSAINGPNYPFNQQLNSSR